MLSRFDASAICCESPPFARFPHLAKGVLTKKALAQELAKAEMLREAEAQMAGLLEEAATWQGEHPEATWDELELEVLQLRQRFGAQLARVLAKQRAEAQPVPGPQCPECGQEMHYKGQKERQLVEHVRRGAAQPGLLLLLRVSAERFSPSTKRWSCRGRRGVRDCCGC